MSQVKYARIAASAGNTEHRTDVNILHDSERFGAWQGASVEVGPWRHPTVSCSDNYLTVRFWEGESENRFSAFRKAHAHFPLAFVMLETARVVGASDNAILKSELRELCQKMLADLE